MPSFIVFDSSVSLKFTLLTNDVGDVGVYFVKIILNVFAGIGSYDDGFTFSVKVSLPASPIPPPATPPFYAKPI